MARGKITRYLYVLDSVTLVSINDYVLDSCKAPQNITSQLFNVVQSANKCSFYVCHKRHGHTSEPILSPLKLVPLKTINEIIYCIPCHQAKQQKNPFPNNDSFTNSIFKLIHLDL